MPKRFTKIDIWLAGCETGYRNHRKAQIYKILKWNKMWDKTE